MSLKLKFNIVVSFIYHVWHGKKLYTEWLIKVKTWFVWLFLSQICRTAVSVWPTQSENTCHSHKIVIITCSCGRGGVGYHRWQWIGGAKLSVRNIRLLSIEKKRWQKMSSLRAPLISLSPKREADGSLDFGTEAGDDSSPSLFFFSLCVKPGMCGTLLKAMGLSRWLVMYQWRWWKTSCGTRGYGCEVTATSGSDSYEQDSNHEHFYGAPNGVPCALGHTGIGGCGRNGPVIRVRCCSLQPNRWHHQGLSQDFSNTEVKNGQQSAASVLTC